MFDRLLPDEKAALAAYLAKGGKVTRVGSSKAVVAKRNPGPITISRVAARPATMKLTQGFNFKSLSDQVTRR